MSTISATNIETLPNFYHPQANCEVQIGGVQLAYQLKRGKRKTLQFSVRPEGLTVNAPQSMPLDKIDCELRLRWQWVLRHLKATHDRRACRADQAADWRDGGSFFFLGQSVTLQLDFQPGADGVTLTSGMARVNLPHNASTDHIRHQVHTWLVHQIHPIFEARLHHFAPQLGVQWTRLKLSNANMRWGSARTDGSIRLNWRLVHFRMAIIDYVVVHELSHLRFMNHGPQFWNTVRSIVPNYAALRLELKGQAVE
jgi:predicted metal-dependent hydrolase